MVIYLQGSNVCEYCTLRDFQKVYERTIILYSGMSVDNFRREIVSLVIC